MPDANKPTKTINIDRKQYYFNVVSLYKKLKNEFESPTEESRSLPFWAWNDLLCEKELVRQIHEMKEQGIGGFFIHSREGLETEYLSDKWLSLVETCVNTAKELGMEAWLYDEDRWPSGTAGGKVTREGGDDSRCKGLTIEVTQSYPCSHTEELLSTYIAQIDDCNTHALKSFRRIAEQEDLAHGEVYLICRIEVAEPCEWFNDEAPPDNLNPISVRRFIDSTHEKYKAKIGHEFGKTVKGIFTDEPGLHDTNTKFNPTRGWIPFTYIFPAFFAKKRGYDLLDFAPLIFFSGSSKSCCQSTVLDSTSVRHDFWRCITELYVYSMSEQVSLWCKNNNIAYTGHFLQEARIGLSARVGGAVMPHYVHQDIPGIDLLCEQANEYITVRQCTSVANQYNRPWVLTETYGCTGWGFTFEGQKWLGDWQYVMGVTRRSQHLALYSIKGCRKRDYPPVFNYNTSWWEHNKAVEDYFARLSAMLSKGRPVRDILIMHPSTTAWALLGSSPYGTPRRRDERDIPNIDTYGYELNHMIKYLMGQHYDFDLGDELIMEQEAYVEGDILYIKDVSYKTVIIPRIETMLRSTFNLLMSFLEAGGRVIILQNAEPFSLLDGRKTAETHLLFRHKNTIVTKDMQGICNALTEVRHVSIKDAFGYENPNIYYLLKQNGDINTLFIVNHSRTQNCECKVNISNTYLSHVQEWDLLTGEIYDATTIEGGISLELKPTQSALYVYYTNKQETPGSKHLTNHTKTTSPLPHVAKTRISEKELITTTTLSPVFNIKNNMPNALTLDNCAYRINDGSFSENMQVWQAQKNIRETLGMRQIYYNGITQRYKWVNKPHKNDGTNIELKFQFFADHLPVEGIYLAIENAENFLIQLNDTPSEPPCTDYFLDKSINIVPLKGLRLGINTLTIACAYKNNHELEDCYIIGNFGLNTDRCIIKKPSQIRLGDWCLQGFMHYAGGLTYTTEATINLNPNKRYFIDIGHFKATVVKIGVNNKSAGYIPWGAANPLEITNLLKNGCNTFEIELIGSPRNLFGPFHLKNGEPENTSWQSFRAHDQDYTAEYNLQPYGLFKLVRIMETIVN